MSMSVSCGHARRIMCHSGVGDRINGRGGRGSASISQSMPLAAFFECSATGLHFAASRQSVKFQSLMEHVKSSRSASACELRARARAAVTREATWTTCYSARQKTVHLAYGALNHVAGLSSFSGAQAGTR